MDRRDLSKALIASATGAALLSERANAQTCTLPCYPRTGAENRTQVLTPNQSYEPVNVKRYGAAGDGVADDTAAIQAAIDAAVRANPGLYDGPNVVYFPQGRYLCSNQINIPGAVTLLGEPANSYAGSFVYQTSNNTHLFVVTNTTNAAVFFENMAFQYSGATSAADVSLFYVDPAVGSGNSFHFRNCWFAQPCFYAINVQKGDDLQIINCTFDVTAQRFIRLGSATNAVSNVALLGNTFYAGLNNLGFIDAYNVNGMVVSGNRVYSGGPFTCPYFISSNFVGNVSNAATTITGNEFNGIKAILLTKVGAYTVVGNTAVAGGALIQFAGGGTITGCVVVGNRLSGASGGLGVIDAFGTNLQYSVIADNIIDAGDGGQSNYGISLPTSSSGNNKVHGNLIINTTLGAYNVASYLNNGIDAYLVTSSITPGTLNPGASYTNTTALTGVQVAGVRPQDEVTFNAQTPTWPLPAGIVVHAFASANNVVSFHYQNVTASAVLVPQHSWSVRIRRNDSLQ